jgi:transposase
VASNRQDPNRNNCCFAPRACKAHRAKTKGKVERPYRYIRQDFLADSTGGCNTLLEAAQAGGVLQMTQRPRIYYTGSQNALMWERWQKGESLQHIAGDIL